MKVFFDKREIAKSVPAKQEDGHPGDTSDNIIKNELFIMHFADSGDEWGKSSDNRQTCYNRLTNVSDKLFRLFQVPLKNLLRPSVFFLPSPR
jgi:hypothetical protein